MKVYNNFFDMFKALSGSKNNSTANQTRSTVKIMVDYENNAEEWWDNGGRELWREFGGGRKDEIYLTERAAEDMERRAQLIPGYHDGPYYAPTALIFDYDA